MKAPETSTNSGTNGHITHGAWVIDTPTVASDVIDGELVVMNLATGNYFSSAGVGVTVWACLEKGWDRAAIVDAVEQGHEASRPMIEADLDAFIETLRSHRLLRACAAAPEPDRRGPAGPSAPRVPYEAPQILVYSDMQDLLLLDPIHEVSDEGWPTRGRDAASPSVEQPGP